jgi:hypothetical protein
MMCNEFARCSSTFPIINIFDWEAFTAHIIDISGWEALTAYKLFRPLVVQAKGTDFFRYIDFISTKSYLL